ncbi:MAG: hypothetical protein OXO52_14010 [Rhodospirillales bacterium]|nr:hypothetical protein [Rhodospirillales bacterium]
MSTYKKLTTIAAVAALAIGLAACGGGDDTTMEMPPPPPPPTPYEMAVTNIAAADTEEAAQAAYDAVKDDVTAAQGEMLQMRVDARIAAIQMAARADAQKMALADAAGAIDTSDLSTQALVDAARAAIADLRQALTDAADVSEADKAMYMTQLTDAVDAVDMAQGGIDTATRRMNQMTALSDASDTLQAALSALSGVTPTQDQIDAANTALAGLNTAITGGADLTDAEKAPYQREADNAGMPIQTAQNARDLADDDANDQAARAMRLTASRMYGGIGAAPLNPTTGDLDNTAATQGTRTAAYTGTNDADIRVRFDSDRGTEAGDVTDMNQVLEATDMAVAANHGWEGKQYTASGTDVSGTYEAVVYSDVGASTMGRKFGNAEIGTPQQYEYTLTNGMLTIDASTTSAHAARVGGSSFDHTAGVKLFQLPSPNPSGATRVSISGSFHGVSGTYTCTPTDGTTCGAEKAARGFTLGLRTDADNTFAASDTAWTFRPGNPEARVTDMPDTNYSSYGWWLHKSADGRTWTASAFVDDKGTAPADITGLDALNGTATYMGGAAGKYSLFSLTGGTNDAGHFTARATLEADFDDDTIEGTIDQFMGADGESRDWSVELMKSHITDAGALIGTPDGTTDATAAQQTVWTIDGVEARAGGQWSGNLKDNAVTATDPSGVPKVATGTFHSVYALDGRMVGAFGANKQ